MASTELSPASPFFYFLLTLIIYLLVIASFLFQIAEDQLNQLGQIQLMCYEPRVVGEMRANHCRKVLIQHNAPDRTSTYAGVSKKDCAKASGGKKHEDL